MDTITSTDSTTFHAAEIVTESSAIKNIFKEIRQNLILFRELHPRPTTRSMSRMTL